ncbi:hypothetical protein B0H13DRAFT_1852432 [Mycena leptocephala]|nr:hypothetical protein B0H13DRAFT_1852432 [Mycena leptocephala]
MWHVDELWANQFAPGDLILCNRLSGCRSGHYDSPGLLSGLPNVAFHYTTPPFQGRRSGTKQNPLIFPNNDLSRPSIPASDTCLNPDGCKCRGETPHRHTPIHLPSGGAYTLTRYLSAEAESVPADSGIRGHNGFVDVGAVFYLAYIPFPETAHYIAFSRRPDVSSHSWGTPVNTGDSRHTSIFRGFANLVPTSHPHLESVTLLVKPGYSPPKLFWNRETTYEARDVDERGKSYTMLTFTLTKKGSVATARLRLAREPSRSEPASNDSAAASRRLSPLLVMGDFP